MPDRTTVGRWWKRHLNLLEETFARMFSMLQFIATTTHLIPDSTPLEDLCDMEAEWSWNHEGQFMGFKLHSVVNQLGLLLKTVLTLGNQHDLLLLPRLLGDLEADCVLADAGYDLKNNVRLVKAMGAIPVIAPNPGRGRRRRLSWEDAELLRAYRCLVEKWAC